jgi:hypothetical protein
MTRDERAMLAERARDVYRSDAEVVRVIIRGAYEALKEREAKERSNDQKELQPA